MKKIIPVIVSTVFFIVAITNSSLAGTYKKSTLQIAATENEKKLSSPSPVVSPVTVKLKNRAIIKEHKAMLRAARANRDITNYVNTHFTDASGITIYSVNDLLVSKFMMNDRSARAIFDVRGNWLYAIINGTEKDLPASDKRAVHDRFQGFSVTLVQELRQDDITCYKVFLEKDNRLNIILVYNGEITIDKKFVN